MDLIMVSKILVGMSPNNINLLQFEIQNHLQKPLEYQCIKTHSRGKKFKILTISVAIFSSSKGFN